MSWLARRLPRVIPYDNAPIRIKDRMPKLNARKSKGKVERPIHYVHRFLQEPNVIFPELDPEELRRWLTDAKAPSKAGAS